MGTLKRTQLTQSTASIVSGTRDESDGGLTRIVVIEEKEMMYQEEVEEDKA